jgi:acetyl-CoA C-acetyltransferase
MSSDEKNRAVILSAARTPIGRIQGTLSMVPAAELAATVVHAAVQRADLSDTAAIDEVLIGNVVSAGLGQNIARQASILGGLPANVGASTINKVCGASLKAVMLAAQAIRAGDGNLFVVGGVESMSQTPFLVDGRLGQLRYGNAELRDSVVVDGLWCAFEDWAMGHAAEFISDEFEITREAMDWFALSSHHKAIAAVENGRFDDEIVPVTFNMPKGQTIVVSSDEAPRKDTSWEALNQLSPVFKPNGKVTAGNSPGLNDAAAALVVASQAYAEQIGTEPFAHIVGYVQVAVQPKYIFAAPAKAIPRLLEKINWTLSDVDLIELNEAFAAQVLANGFELAGLGWDWERVNVNGGAIALGHPLGATGARILTTLLYALRSRGLKRGIASLCLGGGEAIALAVEVCY